MKKIIIGFFLVFFVNDVYSQSPNNFTYQSVVRDASGKLMSNKEISFRISILKSSQNGSNVYSEEHGVITNTNGLATMIIGKGLSADEMDTIDWSDGPYYLKVEVDPEGGFNYIAEDTTQLLSVPYALYSNSSGTTLTITGQDYLTISNNEITVNKVDLNDDVEGVLPVENGGTGSSTAPMVGVITAADAASARNVLGLSTVASSGSYNDLTDKLTAGTNIDITNGVISSTDTNTTYTAGTGISIDGNNSISSTITQYTDADAQAALTAGTNIDITNGVISSTDTNTTYTAGTGISIDGSNAISTTVTDTDTVRSVTAGGNTLADGETLAFTAGSNVTITENSGAVTISSTDTNTTYSVGDGGLTQNNFTNALKSKLDGLNTPAIYDNSGSPALETGITAAEIRSLIGVDASGSDNSTNVTLAGSYDYLTLSGQAITLGQITNDDLAGSIADSKLNQITTVGKVALSSLEIDGGTDIGAAITDSDLIIIDDGANGTNRKAAVSRLKTYVQSATSLDDLTDAMVEDNSLYVGNDPSSTTSSAQYNVAVGATALDAVTTGDNNTAVGYNALTANTTGIENTALASRALLSNISGVSNTASGYYSLQSNTTGSANTASGAYTLYSNTTGAYNTAIGSRALQENIAATENTAVGYYALRLNTSGDYNTASGSRALYSNTTGDNNTALGYRAGNVITTGSNNTIIGYDADPSANNSSNQIVIGKGATGQGNNYAVIGNADVTRVYAAQDAGATVYAGGINLSGGTTVSAVKFGTVTMSTSDSQAFTVSGVTSSSIVTASFKSGDNGRYIKTVVPSTDTITITLDGAANNGVIMYIIIN